MRRQASAVSHSGRRCPTQPAITPRRFADVKQDGIKDIAILDAVDGKLRILLGKSDATFDEANPIVIQVVAPTAVASLPLTSVAFGDFNSDRIVDIAIGGRDGVRVYLGDRVADP